VAEELTIYEKARIAGCDEHHIERSQLPFDTNAVRTIDIHESHDRVLIHAMWYDAGGKSVSLGHIGIYASDDGVVLWRRCPPAVTPQQRALWITDDMRKAWAHVNARPA
jgi:hypothetical protein